MRPSPGLEEIELYPVNEPYAYVRVTYDGTTHEYTYNVLEPVLSPAEQELFSEIKERLFETLNVTTRERTRDEARTALRESANMVIADYGIHLTPLGREKILYHVEKEFLGDGLIDPVMHDKYIEDISCDGTKIPLFLYHRKYQNIKTNILFDEPALNSLAIALAQRSGKHVSIGSPLVDATLPDGSRLQLTFGSEVTTRGTAFTFRKFREAPFTPVELMETNTFDVDQLVYFWMAIENNKSLLFIGGTASGKTTSLNAVALFIPPLAKVISIEDTREITLYHENWVANVTRETVSEGLGATIGMFDLLKAAMRQRPEYILVGEVRGSEHPTLFQAMST